MASEISINGIGSGIDFTKIRDAILTSRSRPITQLQSKSSDYNNKIEGLKQLNASLAALTAAATALTNRDLGSGRNATSRDATILTSAAASQAASGSFDINITRLASALSQASRNFSSAVAPVLADGATAATFELRQGGAASGSVITIDSTNNTLAGLRDAINAAGVGIKAGIVDINGDGTQQQLVLNSAATGTSERIELVETTATGTQAGLNLRSLNPPDGDFTRLDAAFSVNGLSLTRSSNTVSDALDGVTLTFKKTGSTAVNVTASNEIESKLRSFIGAYNTVQDFVAGQYKKDAKGRPNGILAGDATLRSAQKQLRETLGAESTANGGTLTNLTQLGITVGEDGRLAFDSAVLNEKLKTGSEDVKSLLFGKTVSQKGIFQGLSAIAESLSNTTTGAVQTAINGYQSSVESIGDTVTNRLEILSRLRDTLTRQYAAADSAIGLLNGQNTTLTNILKSLQSNSNA